MALREGDDPYDVDQPLKENWLYFILAQNRLSQWTSTTHKRL